MCDCAMIYLLRTSVTYIWSFIKPFTAFFLEIPTGLIACWTGSTFNTTKKYLSTDIGLFTMVTMGAKVSGIIKSSFVIQLPFIPMVEKREYLLFIPRRIELSR